MSKKLKEMQKLLSDQEHELYFSLRYDISLNRVFAKLGIETSYGIQENEHKFLVKFCSTANIPLISVRKVV